MQCHYRKKKVNEQVKRRPVSYAKSQIYNNEFHVPSFPCRAQNRRGDKLHVKLDNSKNFKNLKKTVDFTSNLDW